MSMMDLFQQVRKEIPLDLLEFDMEQPVIFTGEGMDTGWNSGGRSVVFERNGETFRIKGVDPKAELTKLIQKFEGNKLTDVQSATKGLVKSGAVDTHTGHEVPKPFGVLHRSSISDIVEVYHRLQSVYSALDLQNPAALIDINATRLMWMEENTYQVVFRLPDPESDLRLEEFNELVTARFNQLGKAELIKKYQSVMSLYGRFNRWLGATDRLMVESGLVTHPISRMPQNYVIAKANNGYGLFRIDHTSTELTDDLDTETRFQRGALHTSSDMFFTDSQDSLRYFNQIPTGLFLATGAAEYESEDASRKNLPLFERAYSRVGTQTILTSRAYTVNCELLTKSYLDGFRFFPKSMGPIDESFFRRVLE